MTAFPLLGNNKILNKIVLRCLSQNNNSGDIPFITTTIYFNRIQIRNNRRFQGAEWRFCITQSKCLSQARSAKFGYKTGRCDNVIANTPSSSQCLYMLGSATNKLIMLYNYGYLLWKRNKLAVSPFVIHFAATESAD